MLPVQVEHTVSTLGQVVVIFEAVVGVRNAKTLQLRQTEDVQRHLGTVTCLQL